MSTGVDRRDWTRRRVLAAGCAAVGTIAMGGAAAAATRKPDEKSAADGPFKLGLQSYSLRGYRTAGHPDTAKALKVSGELGVHYWEAYPDHIPLTHSPQQIEERKRQLKNAGVQLMGYGVVHLGKDADANRKYFEFARAMGLKYLSVSPDPAAFDLLDKQVEEYGIPIGIHNHGPGDPFAKIETIAKAIKDHHPKIGCCVDTGHFLRSREDPVHAVEVFGNAGLRRPPERREGRQHLHRPGQGRPAHRRPAEAAGEEQVRVLPGHRVRGESGEPRGRHRRLPGGGPQGHRRGVQGLSTRRAPRGTPAPGVPRGRATGLGAGSGPATLGRCGPGRPVGSGDASR